MMKVKPFEISRHTVYNAYKQVRVRKGAGGVDKMSLEDFNKDWAKYLYRIWNRMSSGSYMAPAVKLVEISKKGGGVRPLGIPTICDRIAQTVVKMHIEDGLEEIFHKDSYGYRTNRTALDAVAKAMSSMNEKMRNWRILRNSSCTLTDIAKAINPIIRGWINYYGKFYQSKLRNFMHALNVRLAKWARQKYKNLRVSDMKAMNWLHKVSQESPGLFAHWTIGAKPSNGINNKSRMTGDCHVRFRENIGAEMPGFTR